MLHLLLTAILAASLTGCALSDTYCEGPSKKWHKFGDNCYLFQVGTNERMSYYDAEDFCRTKGAHIVSILSEEENKFVADTVNSHTYYYGRLWIGLNILQGPEKHQWSDGSTFNYENFISKQQYKKESCFIFYGKEGGWRPEHCGLHYTPICKRPASDVEPSPLPPLTPDIPEGNCPSEWIQYGHRCYKFFGANVDDRLKYGEAKTACLNLGEQHDLASIHSMDEQAFLTQRLYDFGTSAWIGFRYIENDQIGHDLVFGWTDNSRENFTFWAPGHPPRGTWKYCAYLNYEGFGKGEWIADYCDLYKRGYICQRQPDPSIPKQPEPTSDCDERSAGFKNSCYRYHSSAQNWGQAEKTCQQDGGHLVTINDAFEQNFLYEFIEAKSESLWTGLRNVKNTRIFKWASGEPLYYSNWGESQPDVSDLQSSCVSTSASSLLEWNVERCNAEKPFICETTRATPPVLPEVEIGDCPSSDLSWIDIGDKYCYQEGQGPSNHMGWGDNSRFCMSKGMEMISLSSEHQMKSLFSYLWQRRASYWLGLIRSFDKESFMWIDGSSLSYTNWADREPSESSRSSKKDCVAVVMEDLKWYPSSCNDWSGYLCRTKKIPAGPNVRVARSEEHYLKANVVNFAHKKTGSSTGSSGPDARVARSEHYLKANVVNFAHEKTGSSTGSSGATSLLIAAIVCLGLSVFVAAMVFAWKRRNADELPITVTPVQESEASSNENRDTATRY